MDDNKNAQIMFKIPMSTKHVSDNDNSPQLSGIIIIACIVKKRMVNITISKMFLIIYFSPITFQIIWRVCGVVRALTLR